KRALNEYYGNLYNINSLTKQEINKELGYFAGFFSNLDKRFQEGEFKLFEHYHDRVFYNIVEMNHSRYNFFMVLSNTLSSIINDTSVYFFADILHIREIYNYSPSDRIDPWKFLDKLFLDYIRNPPSFTQCGTFADLLEKFVSDYPDSI